MTYVIHRYELPKREQSYLKKDCSPKFGYNGFGELIFYRTYSRTKSDGGQESWADCVIRVVNGLFSIRKDFYLKNHIPWEDDFWDEYAELLADSMFRMEWLPPGRGLWAMGSDFVFERGAMALYNCAYTLLRNGEDLVDDVGWLMDSLMHGVGVGFGPVRDEIRLYNPVGHYDFVIPDTREGWVDCTKAIVRAYTLPDQKLPRPIYDLVRPAGMPIKGFGGITSGPEPLRQLHQDLIYEFENYRGDPVYLKCNIANRIGTCVVAGNVRRSAEIACGMVTDATFLDLKDYTKYPERESYGWMSNNSAILKEDDDFDMLGEIAQRVLINGEPGVINAKNLPKGRIGKNDIVRPDQAIGFNPCGEIPLEHREVCNLSETIPTMCLSVDRWYKACEYAAFYSSTVSLLPTHQPTTNRVVARNRRIGVGIIDVSGWKHENGVHKVTRWLRNGYDIVRETNKWANGEAGVPEAIRVTTIKPGGTVPKLPGKTSGLGHPTFKYTLRRVRVQQGIPFHEMLIKAGVPYECDWYSKNTDVFEFPIIQGPAKPANEVTIWEQANNLVLLQREWSDNAVSNTLYFRPQWMLTDHFKKINGTDVEGIVEKYIGYPILKAITDKYRKEYLIPEQFKFNFIYHEGELSEVKIFEYDPNHEENDVEPVLSSIIPLIKSVSLLPHTPKGVYKQMPEEEITEEEYIRRIQSIRKIDWSKFHGSDGMDERYCSGDTCSIGGSE